MRTGFLCTQGTRAKRGGRGTTLCKNFKALPSLARRTGPFFSPRHVPDRPHRGRARCAMSTRARTEKAAMATQTLTKPKQNQTVEDKIQQLRQLYADAPEFAKTALENTLRDLASAASQPRSRMESAGRTGSRQGTV